MVKTIAIKLEDSVFKELKATKILTKKTSWEEFFLDAVNVSETQRKGVN